MEERFTYDNLNRLKRVALNGGTPDEMHYDAYGRIGRKERDGAVPCARPKLNPRHIKFPKVGQKAFRA